jgi:adenylylsulfate kinase
MSWAIWITGLPGSGKSGVARAAVDAMEAAGEPVTLLELDEMRRFVTPAPTYSDAERDLVYRALVYVAATLVEAGVPVVIDATAHRRVWRDLARVVIGAFAEVQLTCPLQVCRERERSRTTGNAPRGIYAGAGTPQSRVPGVDVPYEPATSPELTIDTTQESPEAAGARVADLVAGWPRARRRAAAPGCVVWLTGLPGSGKTTIASHVAEALDARGVAVRVLDLPEVRQFLAECAWTPLADDIAHRALVYAAKRLSEAGAAVIVDATAPARVWRHLARGMIARFAEVQLLCPTELCGRRERAVRWRLLGCAHRMAPPLPDRPDIVLAYEHALNPEVTIHTDVEDPWSAADAVVRLTMRLHTSGDVGVA